MSTHFPPKDQNVQQFAMVRPELLDLAAGLVSQAAMGTDIEKELRKASRDFHGGKPYVICRNTRCGWSGHVEAEIGQYSVKCPECSEDADVIG